MVVLALCIILVYIKGGLKYLASLELEAAIKIRKLSFKNYSIIFTKSDSPSFLPNLNK